MTFRRGLVPLWTAVVGFCVALRLGAVTITEIQYNPPGDGAGLEFIEIHNEAPTVADISGWSFTEGVSIVFPRGTWIPGRGYLVIVSNQAAFSAAYPGVMVGGVYGGRLDSNGESLVLTNNGGGEVLRVRYNDRGKWPASPWGTGHTLSLRRPHLDPGEPESWAPSLLPGGTPGAANFPGSGSATEVDLVPAGATWFYKKGTAEFSAPVDAWRQPAFNPTGWISGTSGFGFGDGDDATELADMANGYWSVAIRRTFTLNQAGIDAVEALVLGASYDDGFVAYLNGQEVVRASMPGNPGEHVPFDTAAVSHEIAGEEQWEVPKSALRVGTNVLAIQGHNTAIASSDFSLAPRLFNRKSAPSGSGAAGASFNEFFGRTAAARWVELYNPTAQGVDLSGYFLSDNPSALDRYPLPPGSSIAARGFLVIQEAAAGLDFSAPELRLFLTLPDRSAVVAAAVFSNVPQDGIPASRQGYSDALIPDGSGDFAYASIPTPGAANAVQVAGDVVINEIFYNPPDTHPSPEFLELHNRGATTIDLTGWRLRKAVEFVFPSSSIPAGGYAVISADPAALQSIHGLGGVLGPWLGNLSNSGESIELVDTVGNVVDRVRYYDGGRWSSWADGGGSSLELVDPAQDSSLPTAWEASDESGKAQWTQISYTGTYTPEAGSEIHFLLLAAGTVLLDDISLRRQGSATEYLPNGNFEASASPWLLQGNHIASHRSTADSHGGSACLELVATGGGDNGVNKIDSDTSPTMTAGTYTLSFWAKWVRGVRKILSRSDSGGNGSLARVSDLTLPAALGTPGAENSARLALKAQFPDGNLGPVLGEVSQLPVVPGAGSSVTVRARAHDAQGISSLAIRYRTGGLGNGVFASSSMFDDGTHGDGDAADGIYAGSIPPHPLNTRVVFYLEGTDTAGRTRSFPVEAPQRTLLYAVETAASPTGRVTVRLNLDDENDSELRTRLLHSDDLVDASFVYNDEEIYYNVGTRYRGSPWNRPPDPKMFRVRFNEDAPFIRGLKAVNLSRYGSAQNEGVAYFCVQHASKPGVPSPVGDYIYARVMLNTGNHGSFALVESVDSNYLEKWFPHDADGYIHKIPGRRYLNDAGSMDSVDWTTFAYRGAVAEAERYRWYFVPNSLQEENRWADLVRLCSVMDVSRTPVATFDQQIETILDVEQFLRVEAARVLQDDWDTIGIGNGQNAYVYLAPVEGRFKLLPWDMDHTFGNVQAKVFPEGSEAQISRLVQRPKFRRIYLRILDQMMKTPWDPTYLGGFLTQTGAVMGDGGGGILGFVNARRPSVLAQIGSNVQLRITRIDSTTISASWPGVYYTASASARLTVTAPVVMETIAVLKDGEQLELPQNFTAVTGFTMDIPTGVADASWDLLGFDTEGNLAGSFSFRTVSTLNWQAPSVGAVLPGAGTIAGGTEVRILGDQFHEGARVFFGTSEATGVTFVSPVELRCFAPAGAAPGQVLLRVTNADNQSGQLANAYEYTQGTTFIRGDATMDASVDIADGVKTLFYLFSGVSLGCVEAADTDNSGAVNVSDVLALLAYIFRSGAQPAAPFPLAGEDPALPATTLGCENGL